MYIGDDTGIQTGEYFLDDVAGAVATSVTFTANGTYTAPSGSAYTPVTVAIPTYDGTVI